MVFEVKGYGAQTLLWEKHEFRMHIPAEALSSSETCLVFVKAITTGLFKFPVGTEPVSAIYAISLSKMFNKPVKLELQHCVRLGQSKFMTFAVAPQDMRSLPYEFQPVAGGVFDQKEFFGSVDRHQFSFVAIFWDWLQYMLYSKNKQTPGENDMNIEIASVLNIILLIVCRSRSHNLPCNDIQNDGVRKYMHIPLAPSSVQRSQYYERGCIVNIRKFI